MHQPRGRPNGSVAAAPPVRVVGNNASRPFTCLPPGSAATHPLLLPLVLVPLVMLPLVLLWLVLLWLVLLPLVLLCLVLLDFVLRYIAFQHSQLPNVA